MQRKGVEILFEKILVPMDGSEPSKHALKYAIAFASKWNAELLVISVIPPIPAQLYSESDNLLIDLEEYDKAIEQIHVKVLDDAKKIVNVAHSELTVTTFLAKGYVPTKIVEIAEEKNVDLIVMGNRGFSGIKNWLLGSVSKNVVERCTKPILIVK